MELVLMKTLIICISLALIGGMIPKQAHAQAGIKPTPAEQDVARTWTQTKLMGQTPTVTVQPHIQVIRNNDPVQLNGRHGKPLNLSGKKYTKGIYCHAVSRVIIHLGTPAKSFSAVVGVDSNEQTLPVKGSVHFVVSAGEKLLYSSPLMREGMPGLPVEVPLNGAADFILDVDDGGDGIACDQADWADAKVILANGQSIWLGEIPMDDQQQILTTDPPFSFVYNGRPSSELLAIWPAQRGTKKLDSQRTQHTVAYTDPNSGLRVLCEGISYADYPAIEWVVKFRNDGSSDTAILENIQAINLPVGGFGSAPVSVHSTPGTTVQATDFQPLINPLAKGSKQSYAPSDGRPCGGAWPYYNLNGSSGGVILAVGWPGQWQADFVRGEDGAVQITAGQQLTHMKLQPGESVRTPLIAMLFYRGEWLRSQNLWRRWMLDHNLPRVEGKLPTPQFTPCSSHQFAEMTQADEASQKLFIDGYIKAGMKPDYWWMDAGWYPCDGNWPKTGTWEVDTKRFPNGLRAVSDYAHPKNVKIIVWFEPERVYQDTWLTINHPEWLLTPNPATDGTPSKSQTQLFNLGNPEAWNWLTNHIDGLIKSQGIDLYRQDYNVGPLSFWRGNDAADRQGITENHYVTGYLAYWDELRVRNPKMWIDSCASGGHRNDLETMRRAIPLLRSDYLFEPNSQQAHTYGLALWLPYFGTGTKSPDAYSIRSMMTLNIIGCWDIRSDQMDKKMIAKLLNQWRSVSGEMLGDFYPLTSYTLSAGDWMGWQFYTPEKGTGLVQIFRRSASPYISANMQLQGLEPEASYAVRNVDTGRVVRMNGKELMGTGLPVNIKQMPGTAWFSIKRL